MTLDFMSHISGDLTSVRFNSKEYTYEPRGKL